MALSKTAQILIIAIIIVVAVIAGVYLMTPRPEVKTITIGTTDKISRLDPAYAYDFYTWEVMINTYEGLFKYIPGTTELEPSSIVESCSLYPKAKEP